MRKVIVTLLVVALLGTATVRPAKAQLSLIADTEIEYTLRQFLQPILQAAGVSPSAVTVYIVNDPGLNAFVAGGQNIFINTGLLIGAQNVEELLGVLAHETGHVAGGHLARGSEQLARAERRALIATLLGLAAAAASGQPEAGIAILGGGQDFAVRELLSFTRSMEAAADQAAVSYLDRIGVTSEGLATFLGRLADQELVPTSRQVEYVRTHPLTADRIDAVQALVDRSRYQDTRAPEEFQAAFLRIQAKVYGFLYPRQALSSYGADTSSIPGLYARAIALFRTGAVEEALATMDQIIAREPSNPFLHEFRGQILLENGRLPEARESYAAADRLLPGQPLILIALAQTLSTETSSDADLQAAIAHLENATATRRGQTAFAFRLLATAYGRAGDLGMAAIALAEEGLAQGDRTTAFQQADRAQQILPVGSPGYLRAQDIRRAAEELEE